MTPEAAKQFIDEHHVRFVLAQFVDIHGVAKTKAVPASCLMGVLGRVIGHGSVVFCRKSDEARYQRQAAA